jgi:hypothetical protein
MRTALAILLVVSLAACSDRTKAESEQASIASAERKFDGLVHGGDSLPTGLVRKGWVPLDSLQGSDWAVTAVGHGTNVMVWLDQSLKTDSAIVWKVIDVIPFGTLPKGKAVQMMSCTSEGVPGNEIVALISRADSAAAPAVQQAWRANRAERSFTPLRAGAVVCP